MKVIAIYPGRYQPWHLGHKSVYDALVRQFGVDNVYIATSDKVDPPRSPFNFAEKQQIIAATGIDPDRVVQTRDPYKAVEITSQYNPQDTKLLFAVSAKDMSEDPRFKSWTRRDGTPAYFQPAPNKVSEMEDFDKHGYIFVVPTLDFKVDSKPMRSATEFRREFAAADAATKASMTRGILGTDSPRLVNLLASKITEGKKMKLNDVVNENTAGAFGSVVVPLGATQRRKVKEVDSKKKPTPGDVLDHARRAREHTGQKPIKEAAGFDPKVQALQNELIAKGAKIKADGYMGPATQAAMKQFGVVAPATAKPVATHSGTDKQLATVVQGGPGFTVVTTVDGETQRRTGNRPWRNNNPGNISFDNGGFAKKQGAIGTDGRYAVFPTAEIGMAAAKQLLFSPTSKYINLTLRDAVYRYAPPSENPSERYLQDLVKATGASEQTKVGDLTDAQRDAMLKDMWRTEGFYTKGKIEIVAQPAAEPAVSEGRMSDLDAERKEKQYRGTQAHHAKKTAEKAEAEAKKSITKEGLAGAALGGLAGAALTKSPMGAVRGASIGSSIQDLVSSDQDVEEGAVQQLSVEQLATISDEALDSAYHYGRSSPGNTFGWQANLKSAAFAKKIIDAGVTDIEKISDAIHQGWNVTAQAFVKNPMQFDDSKTMAPEKLQAKLAQREKLMTQRYAQLPEDEKEKDRVVARALLQAITGSKPGVTESSQRVDRLVTRSLRIMRGGTPADAIAALKTVLGEMEYNERPQFYDFFIKQMVDMYGQQGVAEGADDTVGFEVDSENAYNKVMKKFGSVIDWNGDAMVAPRKYWGDIQELVYLAGGEATEVGDEHVEEAWSQKYKNSINCSHPRGFSQKAHCAGKRKHSVSEAMEMTCPDCGMCKSHGSLTEIKKGQKDSNGYTKCWPGKHAEGTKKSSVTGKQVRNCVPNDGVTEDFKMKSDFRKESDAALADFLSRGGEIETVPPNRVRVKPGQSLASKHIGSKRETGRIVGKDRRVHGNKPVVNVSEVNDYFKRRKEEDRIAGVKPPAKRTPQQTDYQKRRNKEQQVGEAKQKPSAQERFNARLKTKHGIDLDAMERQWAERTKKIEAEIAALREKEKQVSESYYKTNEDWKTAVAGAALAGAAALGGGGAQAQTADFHTPLTQPTVQQTRADYIKKLPQVDSVERTGGSQATVSFNGKEYQGTILQPDDPRPRFGPGTIQARAEAAQLNFRGLGSYVVYFVNDRAYIEMR
jgi:hypothetical protein